MNFPVCQAHGKVRYLFRTKQGGSKKLLGNSPGRDDAFRFYLNDSGTSWRVNIFVMIFSEPKTLRVVFVYGDNIIMDY